MWTDGQTDVGHINLIGGLVTRSPPKNQLMAVTLLNNFKQFKITGVTFFSSKMM